MILLVAIETTCRRQSLERLIVGRKEELDDLIAAFGRRCTRSIPIPNVSVVRDDPH